MTVLSILSFDVDRLLANLWIISILILAVLLLDSILLFLHQRRIQEQKRIHMIEQYVPIVEEIAKEKGVQFKSIHLQSKEQAQNAPTPITTYALFYNGEYLTNEQMNDKRFLKLLAK